MSTHAAQNLASAIADALPGEIRAERGRQHLTQAAVYERAGISKSAYLKIENGQRGANMAQLAAICGALGIRLSELMRRAEDGFGASTAAVREVRPQRIAADAPTSATPDQL